jgi:CDGSH-type Zn-finger protein
VHLGGGGAKKNRRDAGDTRWKGEIPMADVRVRALKNGPYEVAGAKVVDQKGNPFKTDADPVYLCRCGQSSNKPFCDGTHTKVGFKAEETAS